MRIRRTLGVLLVGLMLVAVAPAVSEAAHRHHRSCGHSYRSVHRHYEYRPYYYDRGYYGRGYYEDVDRDAPYVAHHGSGRYRGPSRYYDDDYGYRGRSYYQPRYYGSRRVGYHYHGRTRCYSPHRPHIHFGIHLGF